MGPETLKEIIIATLPSSIGILGTILGTILGSFLSLFISQFRTFFYHRKIKKSLHEELKDIQKEIDRLLYYYTRNLQLYGAGGCDPCEPVGISNPIYKNYYKDVMIGLTQNQRISLQMIHSLIEKQNFFLMDITDIFKKITSTNNNKNKDFESLGEILFGGYSNCKIIQFHIDLHIKYKKGPDLSPKTENHKQFLQKLESIKKEIEDIINSGKNIPKQSFEKICPKEYFE